MLVRILIDGYNLLHDWKRLAEGSPRFSETARDELIWALTQYYDSRGIPMTLVFDGRSHERFIEKDQTKNVPFEILYTSAGQSADHIIERAAALYRQYGEVMVVSNDMAVRELVLSEKGYVISCRNFVSGLQDSCNEMTSRLKHYNHQVNNSYKAPRKQR